MPKLQDRDQMRGREGTMPSPCLYMAAACYLNMCCKEGGGPTFGCTAAVHHWSFRLFSVPVRSFVVKRSARRWSYWNHKPIPRPPLCSLPLSLIVLESRSLVRDENRCFGVFFVFSAQEPSRSMHQYPCCTGFVSTCVSGLYAISSFAAVRLRWRRLP